MNSAESPTSAPGAVLLAKYRVDRVIGEGGMGFVVEATHLSLGHRVAVKVLHAYRRQDSEHLARFHREAELIARIQSEHVVRLLDVGVSNLDEPFMVMELLEGRTLGEEIAARGPLPVTEAVDLMLQAVRGVADAHAIGLVHRDIKPANLFVARRGSRPGGPPSDAPAVVKVLDFGLSKGPESDQAPLTSMDATFGTPQYMSPEQLRSAKYVDARTDQHALACVLYEALTARPAFDASSLPSLVMMINTEMPTPPSRLRGGISPALDAVVANAMAKDAKARFADLGAFAAALAPFGGPTARDVAAGVVSALARAAAAPDTTPASGLVAAPPAGALPGPSPTRAPSQVNPHAADFTPGHLPTGGMPAMSEPARRVNSDAMTRQLGASPVSGAAANPQAPPSTRVKGWSDVLPVDGTIDSARGPGRDPGAARPVAAAAPAPPASRAGGGAALRPTPTPVSRKTGGLLQGRVVIAAAAVVSVLGIWLVVSLVRKVDAKAASSGSTSASAAAPGASSVTVVAEDPDEDPAASSEPVVAPGTAAPSASASASASAPKAAPTQTSRRRKRRRH